jgi:hypothetical protein
MSLSSSSATSTSSQPRRSPLLIAKERTLSEFDQIPVMCARRSFSHRRHSRARASSDFTHARSPDPAVRRALADEIRDASINVGFFYVSHHGIPERAVRGAVAAAQAFFARPEAEKLAVRSLCRRGRERGADDGGSSIYTRAAASRDIRRSSARIRTRRAAATCTRASTSAGSRLRTAAPPPRACARATRRRRTVR